MSDKKPPRTEDNIWALIDYANEQAQLGRIDGAMAMPSMDEISTPRPYAPGTLGKGKRGMMSSNGFYERLRDYSNHGGTPGVAIRSSGYESAEDIMKDAQDPGPIGDYARYMLKVQAPNKPFDKKR